MSANTLIIAIHHLLGGTSLSAEETSDAFDVIMRGEGTPAQIGALPTALALKWEKSSAVAGRALAMWGAVQTINVAGSASALHHCRKWRRREDDAYY